MKHTTLKGFFLLAMVSVGVNAAEISVPVNLVSEKGVDGPVGHVVISETQYGLLFTPSLTSLSSGLHGFHLHANASCDPATQNGVTTPAGAAGGHFDSKQYWQTPWTL